MAWRVAVSFQSDKGSVTIRLCILTHVSWRLVQLTLEVDQGLLRDLQKPFLGAIEIDNQEKAL
jgi:hypothetical protein